MAKFRVANSVPEADALDLIAAQLRTEAEHLEQEAARLRDRLAVRKGRAEQLQEIPDAVRVYRAAGMKPDDALQAVATDHDLPLPTVRRLVTLRERQERRNAQLARDRIILQMAQRGQTNAQIGGYFGLSPGRVSKILQKTLREWQPVAFGAHQGSRTAPPDPGDL